MPCITPYRDDSAQRLLFKIASCLSEGGPGGIGVFSFNGRTGVVTLTAGDIATALGCVPACDNNVVTSFNGRQGVVTLTLADVSAVADARYVLKSGDTMTGALTIGNGVLVANTPVLNLSQTWNNAAVAFTAFQSDVTATAAAAGSLLFNFRQNGVSVLDLRTDGRLTLTGRIAATTTSSIGHSVNTSDALNTAVVNVLTVGHTLSAGAGAAGLGARIDVVGDSATVATQSLLRIDSSWIDPVQATRTAAANFILPVSGSLVSHLTLTNNQAQLRDGTAALPALTFQSDPDTGIYRIGANVLGTSVGGVRITSVNSVGLGIGTDAATFKLSLVGTATTADRKIGINGVQVVYLPDQAAGAFLGSIFFGNGGSSLTHAAGFEGQFNTGVGIDALLSNTTGFNNTAVGLFASRNNTTGTNNTVVGSQALAANTTGISNTALGSAALLSNTTGANNTAVGYLTLQNNTTGSNNFATGLSALNLNTTGGSNIAIGVQASQDSVTGGSNIAIGVQALQKNKSSNNIAIGLASLFDLATPATGQNTAIGYNTGRGITTGDNNTILGANVTGLAAALSNNIILADGAGVIRLQIDSSGNTTLTGTLATGDGTAALPAKTFSADLNTGLYRIGADSIGTSTGGTLRITTNTTDVILATAFRLAFASGANQRAGNATLVAGTVTVANTSVTANTVVLLTRKTSGGTIGTAITYTVIAATSFTINSDSVIDTSVFSYMLVEVP